MGFGEGDSFNVPPPAKKSNVGRDFVKYASHLVKEHEKRQQNPYAEGANSTSTSDTSLPVARAADTRYPTVQDIFRAINPSQLSRYSLLGYPNDQTRSLLDKVNEALATSSRVQVKGYRITQNKYTRTKEITEISPDKTSSRKGSPDLTVLAREEAEEQGIVHPVPSRDSREAVFNESFIGYIKRKLLCCVCGLEDKVSDSRSAQSQSQIALEKRNFSDTPMSTGEIELTRIKTEHLRDAQFSIWEGHLSQEEVVRLMEMDQIVSMEMIVHESRLKNPTKVTFKSGITAIFKGESLDDSFFDASYRHEIGAYEVGRLVFGEENMVPVTLPWKINGEKGSLQLWVNDLVDLDLPLSNEARLLGWLIAETDRSEKRNVGYRNGRMVLYDNAISFRPVSWNPPSPELVAKLKPERASVLENLRNLNEDMLKQIGCLLPEEIAGVLKHRDMLLEAIDKAASNSG